MIFMCLLLGYTLLCRSEGICLVVLIYHFLGLCHCIVAAEVVACAELCSLPFAFICRGWYGGLTCANWAGPTRAFQGFVTI